MKRRVWLELGKQSLSATKIQLANLLSRELCFYFNTSRGVWFPQQLLFKAESTSCKSPPQGAWVAGYAGLGPVENQVGQLVQASKVSHFHTFGPWLYSLPSVFLGPKVSWQLELIWLSKQKPKTECAGFYPVMRSSGFPSGWPTKWPPNGLQKVFLESWDLKLQGGVACRKLPLLDLLPQAWQNRAAALTLNPEMRSFAFGSGWPTKRCLLYTSDAADE